MQIKRIDQQLNILKRETIALENKRQQEIQKEHERIEKAIHTVLHNLITNPNQALKQSCIKQTHSLLEQMKELRKYTRSNLPFSQKTSTQLKRFQKVLGLDAKAKESEKLLNASKSGDAHIVRLLIDSGVNVDHVDKYGRTALMLASEEGHVKIVQLLLEADSDVDHVDMNLNTALFLAVMYGHTDVARLLIEAGADLNHKNIRGFTVLAFAEGKKIRKLIEDALKIQLLDYNRKKKMYMDQLEKKRKSLKKHVTMENLKTRNDISRRYKNKESEVVKHFTSGKLSYDPYIELTEMLGGIPSQAIHPKKQDQQT